MQFNDLILDFQKNGKTKKKGKEDKKDERKSLLLLMLQ